MPTRIGDIGVHAKTQKQLHCGYIARSGRGVQQRATTVAFPCEIGSVEQLFPHVVKHPSVAVANHQREQGRKDRGVVLKAGL